MGKKDQMNTGSPVDQYRKRIGQQDRQVKKKISKEMKRQKEAKESAIGIKEVVLVLAAIFAVLVAIYFLLFLELGS